MGLHSLKGKRKRDGRTEGEGKEVKTVKAQDLSKGNILIKSSV